MTASKGPSGWIRARSTVLDPLVALLLSPVLAPVVALLGWRIRRGDGGPAFVVLARCGRDGVPFGMWKLRSMRVAEAGGAAGGGVITASDDDRVTPIGATIRRWRLDELPQVWNVIRGDMALFGPRPETPSLVDLDDERWRAVLLAKPGITGPTQLLVERWESSALAGDGVVDRYQEEILPVKLAADRWYVEHASLLVDLQVAWSMAERFVLGRDQTSIERRLRASLPEAEAVPPG